MEGNLEWGYALADNGVSLIVKSYTDWGDPTFGINYTGVASANGKTLAAQIYYRYTKGPRAGQSFMAWAGSNGKTGVYLGPNYYFGP